jgi:hypothetical protein
MPTRNLTITLTIILACLSQKIHSLRYESHQQLYVPINEQKVIRLTLTMDQWQKNYSYNIKLDNIYGRYNYPYDIVLTTKEEDMNCLTVTKLDHPSSCPVSGNKTQAMIFKSEYDINIDEKLLGISEDKKYVGEPFNLWIIIFNNQKLFKKKEIKALYIDLHYQ